MEHETLKSQDVAEPDEIVSGTAVTGQDKNTHVNMNGDLFFCLYNRQDRISDRLNKKIERLDRRVTVLEERGRSR
jgi:hypothetical protein